jgi:hypothetical protein
LRLTQPQTLQGLVPSLATRQAAPAPMQTVLNMFPQPNGAVQGTSGLANFTDVFSTKYHVNATSFRIDHHATDKLQFFARYNHAPSNQLFPQSLNDQGNRTYSNDSLTGGATWTVSPRITDDFRANWGRTRVLALYAPTDANGAVLPSYQTLMPGQSPTSSYWSENLTFGSTTYIVWGKNADNHQNQLNFVDKLSWVQGNHEFKFGIDYRRLAPQRLTGGYMNAYTFTSLATVLNGISSGATVTNQVATVLVLPAYGMFAQDTWKATGRLALTYGLRWDVAPAPTFTRGLGMFALTLISDLSNVSIASQGTPLYKTDYGSFGPRVGLAYSLSSRPTYATVLRGGFGVMYDVQNGLIGEYLGATPPASAQALFPGTPFPLTGSQLASPPVPTSPPFTNFQGFDPNLKNQKTYQWNLTVEQGLGSQQSLSIAYVGAAGRNLYYTTVVANPNPSFLSDFALGTNKGSSDYDAMQIQFQRRMSKGLELLSSGIPLSRSNSMRRACSSSAFPDSVKCDSRRLRTKSSTPSASSSMRISYDGLSTPKFVVQLGTDQREAARSRKL